MVTPSLHFVHDLPRYKRLATARIDRLQYAIPFEFSSVLHRCGTVSQSQFEVREGYPFGLISHQQPYLLIPPELALHALRTEAEPSSKVRKFARVRSQVR